MPLLALLCYLRPVLTLIIKNEILRHRIINKLFINKNMKNYTELFTKQSKLFNCDIS